MTDLPRLNNIDDTPVFTIKTVVQETGITPATLRAWERRYGCLSPGRSDGGYRLYSARDIAIVRWLKRQVDAGVAISRAVALLALQHRGETPDTTLVADDLQAGAPSSAARTHELAEALLAFEEARAEAVLSEAFALYPVETVIETIVAPAMVEIGERWHRGQASVVQEHFATAFLRHRLTALFQAYAQPQSGPIAVTGSAPSEWHDMGILLISLVLRRHGWRVIYLGQNVPVDHLWLEIRDLRPDIVCLSASLRSSAEALIPFCAEVQQMPAPRPHLILGGRAFITHSDLHDQFAGCIIIANVRELLEQLPRI